MVPHLRENVLASPSIKAFEIPIVKPDRLVKLKKAVFSDSNFIQLNNDIVCFLSKCSLILNLSVYF